MSDKQHEEEDERQWFLRTGGETVFGPVSTQGLVVWAEQGRILPGHEVSSDRKKWVQAVSVDLLDMRWYVDEGGGELRGPLNKLAAEALIKSGKVSEGAQLVSADDVEAPPASDKAAKAQERTAREPVPEEVLRVRIRELEAMVSNQRERLAKLASADALETVQHERDVLASLVKELEAQRDATAKSAEKEARANERRAELLRQQIKKLEQQLEDTHSHLLLSEQAAVGQVAVAKEAGDARAASLAAEAESCKERLEEAARAGAQAEARLSDVSREAEALRAKLADGERMLKELAARAESAEAELARAGAALKKREAELARAAAFHERRAEELAQVCATREAELAEALRRAGDGERARKETEALAKAAEQRAHEADAAFAELLQEANGRDAANLGRIAALEKACALSPEETARFYADQAAVYELVKAEADELFKTLEAERAHVEQLKEWSLQRQQALTERRQTLLKQLGSGPADMTRRSLREQPSDPNATRLRTEFDNLRMAHEREIRQAEDRERELQRKLRIHEADAGKMQALAAEGEKLGRRAQELTELVRKREQELADERKSREAEREQFAGSQQALMARLESLEKSGRPETPDEMQSADARNVKIATWMRLKK